MIPPVLRPVEPGDVAIFYAQQADPESAAMAAVPARDRAAHDEHWARILRDESTVVRTIVDDAGAAVGHVTSFVLDGERQVGYWIDRAHWGRGHATRALDELLALVPERPVHARVARHNGASLHILERAGFERVGAARAGDGVEIVLLRLG
jgi:RimJ/RimL family protein N-acetyltransferase